MQSVPAPPRLAPRAGGAALAFALAAVIAAVAVALAVASQGLHDHPVAQQPAAGYNGLIGGLPLQSARCLQWNAGTSAERDHVAAALAQSVGGATPYGRGTTLSSAQ